MESRSTRDGEGEREQGSWRGRISCVAIMSVNVRNVDDILLVKNSTTGKNEI